MHEPYELKSDGILGSDAGGVRGVRSLNRFVHPIPGVGVEIAADPRRGGIITSELGLAQGRRRAVTTPGSKADAEASGADPTELETSGEITAYRGISARGVYFAADRPPLRFAVKEGARRMARPTRGNLAA